MIQTWFKIFFRNSKKNWLNILVNVLGLTLGFVGLLIVLLFLNDEEKYNTTNSNVDNVYRVLHELSDVDVWSVSPSPEGPLFKQDIPEVTDFYLSERGYRNTVVKTGAEQVYTTKILIGEPEFFDFFSFEIIEGNIEKFKEVRNHIAISENTAKTFFGESSAIGKTLDFYGKNYIVTTVYKIIGKHYFMPNVILQYENRQENSWGNFNYNLFVKTTKHADIKSVAKKANEIYYKYKIEPEVKELGVSLETYTAKYGITTVILDPIKNVRLKTLAGDAGPEGKGNYQMIMILLSLSMLLIIISCVNFINLSIASATQRSKEVGVKKTLGLSKLTLTGQYTLEIISQGILAFIFSLLLVELLLPFFNEFMNKDISLLNLTILTQIGLLAVLVSIIIGVIPSVYLANFKAVEVLKGNISKSKKGVLSRNIMLGIQFLISGFFLTGSIIINQQVEYMVSKDLGFNGNQIVEININERNNRYKKYLLAKQELLKHPNIEAITSNSFTIGGRGGSSSTNIRYKDFNVQSYGNAMDFNYLDVMNIEVLKGRTLNENRASDTIRNVLINETLAKAFNIYDNPIGEKITLGWLKGEDKNAVVVGMVKDYHTLGLDEKIPPTFFIHWNTSWVKGSFNRVQFKIKPNNIDDTLTFLEDYWNKNIQQGYPFTYTFVNKAFARTYKNYQKQQTLFSLLTLIVIIVSLLGLFALATLTIQQRLKEVAIRKTLGASVKEIMFQLMKSFFKIALIASVILIPIAYYLVQGWLDNFVYRIDMPFLPFILTPIILTILVFVIVGFKAFKATKVDLIKYLKFE